MSIKYTRTILLAICYIAGIVLQLIFSISSIYIIIASVLYTLLILIKKKYRLLLLLFFSLGMIQIYITQTSYRKTSIRHLINKKHLIEGWVISNPVVSRKFTKFLFKVKKVNNSPVGGIINIFIKPDMVLKRRDYLIFSGKIKFPRGPANFGEFNYKKYYRRRKINGTIFINKPEQIIKVIYAKNNFLEKFIFLIKKDIIVYLKKHYYPVQNHFLSAVLIGMKARIPATIKEIFRKSGTIHLLAISGLHVGLFTLMLLILFINLRIPRKVSFILILFFIILYNLIIGYRAPILRATIMFMALIICYFFDRDKNYLNSLALAALIILLIDPLAINSISFQMSFLATAGIIIYSPVIYDLFKRYIKWENKIFKFFISIFIASLSAQVFIFPVLLYTFQKFSYIALITNLLAIPLTGIILFITLLSYFFFHLIPIVASLLSNISNLLIAIMVYILNFVSKVPVLEHMHFNYLLLVTYYIIIFFISINIFFNPFPLIFTNIKIKYGLISILLIFFITVFLYYQQERIFSNDQDLEIIFFNIKGKSVLIKTPFQKYILVDSGYELDVKKHIMPFLKRNKIKKLDYLIQSNITRSRSQGIPYLIKEIPVDNYIDSGFPAGLYRAQRIKGLISDKKIDYRRCLKGNIILIDNIILNIYHPSSVLIQEDEKQSFFKKNSMVFKLSYKNKDVLFFSDIKKESISYIKGSGRRLHADIVNLPDLNRDYGSIKTLLKLCRPEVVIVNKRFTYFEQKDEKWIRDVLERYNIKYFFTQENGSVKISFHDDNYRITTSYGDD